MTFAQLGLRLELLQAIKARGYSAPTPIQAKAIPVILSGRDLLARAQTGTGKTDAFALPMVEILSQRQGKGPHPRALVLTPTRELALQVGESIKLYARRVSLRCTVVHGGVRIEPQIERIRRGIDILVATPGRLLDLAVQRHLQLFQIEFLVFDEADRMLDLGFSEEISEILALMPDTRRTMLFSATYTKQIRDLAGSMLHDPQYVEVTPSNTAAEAVVQKVHLVARPNKRALLVHLLRTGKWRQVLVFTRTKRGADKLTEELAVQGISAVAMHGNKSQSLRTRTINEFKSGEIRILVATDVAARGLDISNLPIVVNYDLPEIPEDYVHRIGRTGRAGVSGMAVSLVSPEENPHLLAIEKLLKQRICAEQVPGFTEDSDVPDYVLFRPSSAASAKKADKDIIELLARRKAAKQQAQTRNAKAAGSGKSSGAAAKARSGGSKDKVGKKPTRSGPRPPQAVKQSKPKGRR